MDTHPQRARCPGPATVCQRTVPTVSSAGGSDLDPSPRDLPSTPGRLGRFRLFHGDEADLRAGDPSLGPREDRPVRLPGSGELDRRREHRGKHVRARGLELDS